MQINVPFKPRARLLLQLGEQLIKNESIAILELIKNAYDADATKVTLTMNDIEDQDAGLIIIEDNGCGMDLHTVKTVWMEPGTTHKKDIIESNQRSKLGRLPIGEKGIGRFGVHKLGQHIELVTKMANKPEVYVSINWSDFETANYLEDVEICVESRNKPRVFVKGATGTKITINNLTVDWTRGMLRNVYRAVTSLNSPFVSNTSFEVTFSTNKTDWLKGLLTFDEIKEYALYTADIKISGDQIIELSYEFNPYDMLGGLKGRKYSILSPVDMVKRDGKEIKDLSLSNYKIGIVKIKLYVFDRDPAVISKYVNDKKTFKGYLDDNGGISVFRDGIRIYDYGEPENDWLGFDATRVNRPSYYLSNNIVLGAILLDRENSSDLREKTNREGFIENAAYLEFRDAILFAIDQFVAQRNIDKDRLRKYLKGSREPVVYDVSEIRKRVQEYVPDAKKQKEIDTYLKRIETDFDFIKNMYLKTASAGISYGVIIHEIEKIISELNKAVKVEKASPKVIRLAKHLARLVDNYAELLRNKSKTLNTTKEIVEQSLFSVEYRLEAHKMQVKTFYDVNCENANIKCSSNLVIGSIINLIDNSIWWTRKANRPQIYIKVSREIDGFISIIIADNGIGFTLPPEDLIKPFVSTKPNGMGLGLNIANEIMISQGGELLFPEYGDLELPEEFKFGAVVALGFKEDVK